jgi:hypothetical protein
MAGAGRPAHPEGEENRTTESQRSQRKTPRKKDQVFLFFSSLCSL